jgi:hypothetical protein
VVPTEGELSLHPCKERRETDRSSNAHLRRPRRKNPQRNQIATTTMSRLASHRSQVSPTSFSAVSCSLKRRCTRAIANSPNCAPLFKAASATMSKNSRRSHPASDRLAVALRWVLAVFSVPEVYRRSSSRRRRVRRGSERVPERVVVRQTLRALIGSSGTPASLYRLAALTVACLKQPSKST